MKSTARSQNVAWHERCSPYRAHVKTMLSTAADPEEKEEKDMDWSDISSLLWLLGIAGLFYWMMKKGGCGMHGSHSHGGGQHGTHPGDGSQDHGSETGTFRDPVCGMQVQPERAAGMRTVQGQNFFLCSTNCLEQFDKDPARYAQSSETESPQSGAQPGRTRKAGCH